MFGPHGSLLHQVGLAALFGRRRGADRHGEVPSEPGEAPPLPTNLTFDADGLFEAFAEVAEDRPEQPPVDHDEPEITEAPAWVLGEASLDDPVHPEGPQVQADPRFPDELWHEVPGEPVATGDPVVVDPVVVDAPEPLDQPRTIDPSEVPAAPAAAAAIETAEAPDTPAVHWRSEEPADAATETAPEADGEQVAVAEVAPFQLNRLRRVCGPSEAAATYVDGPTGAATAVELDAEPARPAGAGLIVGPVGRSRARSGTDRRRNRHRTAAPLGRPLTVPADRLDAAARPAGTPPATVPEAPDPAPSLEGHEDRPVPVLVAADGSVKIGPSSVRVAHPEDASASSGPEGLVVSLFDRWCWAALDEFGPDLAIRAGATELHAPAGTTALLSIDDDGSQLVVVLEGEGLVSRDGARIRLRRGAMVFLPVDGEPQVDVAPDEEIRADPLVARNLELDALR